MLLITSSTAHAVFEPWSIRNNKRREALDDNHFFTVPEFAGTKWTLKQLLQSVNDRNEIGALEGRPAPGNYQSFARSIERLRKTTVDGTGVTGEELFT